MRTKIPALVAVRRVKLPIPHKYDRYFLFHTRSKSEIIYPSKEIIWIEATSAEIT